MKNTNDEDSDFFNTQIVNFNVLTNTCGVTLEEIITASGSQQIFMSAT